MDASRAAMHARAAIILAAAAAAALAAPPAPPQQLRAMSMFKDGMV
jgi:hypothetical protein